MDTKDKTYEDNVKHKMYMADTWQGLLSQLTPEELKLVNHVVVATAYGKRSYTKHVPTETGTVKVTIARPPFTTQFTVMITWFQNTGV